MTFLDIILNTKDLGLLECLDRKNILTNKGILLNEN